MKGRAAQKSPPRRLPRAGRGRPADVQIGYRVVCGLDGGADFGGQILIARHDVEKHRTRRAHQAARPLGNNQTTEDAHQRIEPYPAIASPKHERGDRQHRRHRVGDHMGIGRTQIVVGARLGLAVAVMIASVIVVIAMAVGVVVVGMAMILLVERR